MSTPSTFPAAHGNVARKLDAYERGYNAAANVLRRDVRHAMQAGLGLGFCIGFFIGGVSVFALAVGWL